jgi:hypothetical protein
VHQPLEQVERDIDRDRFLTADEAKSYGLIDDVIQPRGRRLPPYLPQPSASESNGRNLGEPSGPD